MKGIATDRSASPSGSNGPLPASSADDVRFMRRALELAERGAGRVSPNPKVGAVIVQQGRIVGEGWHAEYGLAHAEVAALIEAGPRATGATAYVSLEPCNHTGKTGPCSEALIAAGVSRVVFAAHDPNPKAAGGAARLASAGIAVSGGVLEREALDQNAPFFFAARGADRPFVTLKLAVSIDGAIVDASRQPGWLTGEEARAAVHALRAETDAIAVGIGTALADDPALTVRHAASPRRAPLRVVFDRGARLPLDGQLVQSARALPVVDFTDGSCPEAESALRAAGIETVVVASAGEALRHLGTRGVRHLLVEGGAALGSSLLAAGLVDQLVIFQAPVILGAGALSAFAALPAQRAGQAPRLRVVERKALGADLMTVYAVSGD
ncbi:bifunctional diaminohydroxyphosphoribosylaminopyrimidine deaminase/5-amino-6-(5-phosphoribosylamino)uracil reductase RibD [Gemmatimonas groenlandica]|uniref:Riboflavin biosynthesis protein RibD n=1 Tax=Gemmatimonas groenlandica TaxID=2732249 RepID=A0A6M4IMF5_9BACT|nr:bifunctional diaminohydroxyphosphoribosylaminopyrimidine deaminase/5-amino-6-(5-phosphoribosylamino)uracil reductase RibD [Gemmatimonas groenlandica]QJR35255.1 bifunctional diaminohydroxyphosphoribosylaminopyrimidine deaminase/5-amino-6-(5-phosphoribosylamino)uracil reductase RibD [Gemmatimonas groenlandica]